MKKYGRGLKWGALNDLSGTEMNYRPSRNNYALAFVVIRSRTLRLYQYWARKLVPNRRHCGMTCDFHSTSAHGNGRWVNATASALAYRNAFIHSFSTTYRSFLSSLLFYTAPIQNTVVWHRNQGKAQGYL